AKSPRATAPPPFGTFWRVLIRLNPQGRWRCPEPIPGWVSRRRPRDSPSRGDKSPLEYRAHPSFFPRRCPNGCSLFVVVTVGGGRASARVYENHLEYQHAKVPVPLSRLHHAPAPAVS